MLSSSSDVAGPFQNQALSDHWLDILADVSLLDSNCLGDSFLTDLSGDLMIWLVEYEPS